MGVLLILGTLLSTIIVTIGAVLFLYQHGGELLQQSTLFTQSFHSLSFHLADLQNPLAIIKLGLLILIITQVLRVLLLVLFYLYTRDVKFFIMSCFVLVMLVYGLVRR